MGRHFFILKKSICISLVAVMVSGNLGNHIAIKSKEVLSSQTPPMAKLIALPQLIAPRCAVSKLSWPPTFQYFAKKSES